MKKNKIILLIVLALLVFAGFLYFSQKSNTIKKELSDFAVEDTGKIEKLFLVDNEKRSVLLERTNPGRWNLNGKFEARADAVNVLLSTIKRVAVKTPVPKSAFDNVVKQIAAKHVKIEIYSEGDNLIKSYYVGHPNQEHNGTYMLLENSSVPFLMHIEGFRGFLTPRYFTNENEWRSTAVFQYSYDEISQIKLEYPDKPGKSFFISNLGNNKFSLGNPENLKQSIPFDTVALMKYVSLFQKINFEGFEETKTGQFIDSVIHSSPIQVFSVTDKNGKVKTVKMFLKPSSQGPEDNGAGPVTYDLERFYGYIDDKDFVVLQYFVFDPILKTKDDFR